MRSAPGFGYTAQARAHAKLCRSRVTQSGRRANSPSTTDNEIASLMNRRPRQTQTAVAKTAVILAALAGGGLLAAGGASARPGPGLSVVELFTSQGCSSCPPADDNVAALSVRPDVLALSFGVTYWDPLGWKDSFAQPAFTERQLAYARALHHQSPFTPEVVVDGRADVVGNDLRGIERLIQVGRREGPSVSLSAAWVDVGAGPAPRAPADVWLVRYDPHTLQVPIRAGENAGRTLPIKNVVKRLTRLGDWHGEARRFPLPPDAPGLATAILVQSKGLGPILAAARG